MKKPVQYAILFAVPGMVISFLVAYLATGMLLGFLWLFVFGDSSWPDWLTLVVPILTLCIFIVSIASITFWGYCTGKQLAHQKQINRKHIFYSFLATITPVFLFMWQQARISGGNTPSLTCSDYCQSRGYSASSVPPAISGLNTCSCLGDQGETELTVELDNIMGSE